MLAIRRYKTNHSKLFVTLLFCLIATSAHAEKKIMIFGDSNHDVYLGCLNCSEVAADSVHSELGKYGSDLSSTSIFNNLGKYGSVLSQYSPCNVLASNPPVAVDEDGEFYGYLTLNELKPKAITDTNTISWLKYKVCK